eukprot:4704053-Ditylum_brightwellii.AAC.1
MHGQNKTHNTDDCFELNRRKKRAKSDTSWSGADKCLLQINNVIDWDGPPPAPPTKLSLSDFPSFSGEIEDQEKYETKMEAQIRQTSFKFLLTQDPVELEEEL